MEINQLFRKNNIESVYIFAVILHTFEIHLVFYYADKDTEKDYAKKIIINCIKTAKLFEEFYQKSKHVGFEHMTNEEWFVWKIKHSENKMKLKNELYAEIEKSNNISDVFEETNKIINTSTNEQI